MKLSEAIEEALLSGVYNQRNEFMCNVLKDKHGFSMMEELQEHLGSIFNSFGTRPLSVQLYHLESKKPDFSEVEFWKTCFKRTQEWYVWFVFDLKRKGL